MDSNPMVPNWIKEAKAESDRQNSASEARSNRAIAATMTIQAGAEGFWKQFLKELKNNTDNLGLIQMRGQVSMIPNSHNPNEQGCRVSAASLSLTPNSSYMDIYFNVGGSGLRCFSDREEPSALMFCVGSSGAVAVVANESIQEMDAEFAAEFIVRKVVKSVSA